MEPIHTDLDKKKLQILFRLIQLKKHNYHQLVHTV